MDLRQTFNAALHTTDKFTGHVYLETYESLFNSRKESTKNVLEIGVDSGGSLLLWRDFFTNANVYGLDIIDSPSEFSKYSLDRIFYTKENAYTVNCVRNNFENKGMKFDIIIDDGPHSIESMEFLVEHYSVVLAPGGVMVIEDIPAIEWTERIMNKVPQHLKSKARAINLTHLPNSKWDDIMFVIEG